MPLAAEMLHLGTSNIFFSFDVTLEQNHVKYILGLDMLYSRIKLIFKWLFFETSYMHVIHSDHTDPSVFFYFSSHASCPNPLPSSNYDLSCFFFISCMIYCVN